MALERRVVSINFVSGLDQKTDTKLTTKLTTADNVVLRKNGTIEKRTGFVANGNWSLSANPVKAFPFHDGEFVLSDYATDTIADSFTNGSGSLTTVSLGNHQHASARIATNWQPQEIAFRCSVETKQLWADGNSVTVAEVALCGASATQSGFVVANNMGVSTLPNPTSLTTPLAFDIDAETRSFLPSFLPVSTTGWRGRVVSLTSTSSTAVVFSIQAGFSSNTTLYITNVSNTGSPSSVSATVLGVLPNSVPFINAVAVGNKMFFMTKQVTTNNLLIGSYDPSNGAVSTTAVPNISGTNVSHTTFAISSNATLATPAPGTDRIRLFWKLNSGNTVQCFMSAYSLTLSQILAPTAITVGVTGFASASITTTGEVNEMGAVENVGATSVFLAFTQLSITGLSYYTAWNAQYDNSGSVITGNTSVTPTYGMFGRLASAPFMAHGKPSFFLNYNATAQSTYYMVSTFGPKLVPVAKVLSGVGGPISNLVGANDLAVPSVVASPDGDTFYTTLRKAVSFRLLSTGIGITANVGAELVRVNLSQTQNFPYNQFAGSTFIGGGYLSQYDGSGTSDAGLLSAPVIASVSTTTTGGSLGAVGGSYAVQLVKELTDQGGLLHRSQPSLPITFTTSTTTSQATVIFTDGPDYRGVATRVGQIKYVAYRTTNGGSLYYRDNSTSFSTPIAVSLTPGTISMTVSDSTLSGGEPIYTQGGELPNWVPDGPSAMCVHNGRIFCNDPTDGSITRYSKPIVSGLAIEFSIVNTVPTPGVGRVSAYCSLDSNLIVFRKRSMLAITGDGPDATGQNGVFSEAQVLFDDVGCVDQRNLCRFKDGIVFKSPDKGFHLLTRDLQLQFIGADVEDYNSKTVVSSEVVAQTEAGGTVEECRFLCSDGTLLTYNYYNGQWTTATLAGCTDAVSTRGRYVVVNPTSTAANARVFQQSMTTYLDAFSNTSTTYQMTVETGFVKTADVQGFQRIWKVQGLGESMGGGRISVEVGYDYETAYNETYTFSMSSMTTPNYTGGAASAPQFDFVPVRQKCQAIRFRIKDYPTENGAVMKITNLSLECGVKSGVFKLPAAKGA